MNAVTPLNGYDDHSSGLRMSRKPHCDIFSTVRSIAHQLARRAGNNDPSQPVHTHHDSWSVQPVDLVQSDNGITDAVKAGFVALTDFSVRHDHAVMAGNTVTDLLIFIKPGVRRGLRKTGSA